MSKHLGTMAWKTFLFKGKSPNGSRLRGEISEPEASKVQYDERYKLLYHKIIYALCTHIHSYRAMPVCW